MRVFSLYRSSRVKASQTEVFEFFSRPENLQRLTPSWLHFKILTPSPLEMKTGLMIDYRIRLKGIPILWRSEITLWDPPRRFVDEQVKGPYRLWIHEHRFSKLKGECLIEDDVKYAVWGGELIHLLFVRRKLERIFHHRQDVIRQLF